MKCTVSKIDSKFIEAVSNLNSCCIMPISVGQKYHTGEKFKDDLRYIAKRDGAIIIVIADILQRHNLQLEHDYEKALELALAKGDEWLKEQSKVIEEIMEEGYPIYITRWDGWVNHTSFNDPSAPMKGKKAFIDNLYNTDIKLQEAIQNSTNDYVRRTSLNKNYDIEKVREASIQYKLEECAVMLIWADLCIKNLAYPNKLCDALNNIYRRFASPRELLSFTNLANRSKAQTHFFTESSKPIDIEGYKNIVTSPIHVIVRSMNKKDGILFLNVLESEIKRYKHEIANNQDYHSTSW